MISTCSCHDSRKPKRSRLKRGRSQNERKRARTQERKRAQKGTKERKRALPRENCRQSGLKQPGLGLPDDILVSLTCAALCSDRISVVVVVTAAECNEA